MRRLSVFATLVNCLDRWYGVGPAPLHGTVGFVVLDVTSFSRLFYARMSIGPGSLADPWPHNQHLDTPWGNWTAQDVSRSHLVGSYTPRDEARAPDITPDRRRR